MKLNKWAKNYLKKYNVIAYALGVPTYFDKTTTTDKSNNKYEYKAMYHFGKPRGIIVYLGRIKNNKQLVECTIHELMHHVQFLRGLFPKAFNGQKVGSQIRVEKHVRKITDMIIRTVFGIRGHRMSALARKEYSK